MWIFTPYGFFSAVCARKGKGRHGQPIDPKRIMVRARLFNHLKALKDRFEELLDACPIQESSGTDYRFRLFVPKETWVETLAALAEETAYDNFKGAVAEHQGKAGAAYERALHDVWSVMHEVQATEGLPPITAEQIDALLPFLDRFEKPGFTPGMADALDGFEFGPDVMGFLQAIDDHGWVTPAFDWPAWQESAQEYMRSPKKIGRADAATIRKLLMTHVRKERFCEGHLAEMFENGHIAALLRRLRTIQKRMP